MRHNSARVASTSSSSTISSSSAGVGNNAVSTTMGTSRQLSVDSNKPSSQHLQQLQQQLQQIDDNWVELRDKRFSSNSSVASNRQSLKCDASDKTSASGDSSKNSTATITQTTANSNTTACSSTTYSNTAANAISSSQDCVGVEESCLLGIDCNERTTIGLVVPILADTTIHLDGDG